MMNQTLLEQQREEIAIPQKIEKQEQAVDTKKRDQYGHHSRQSSKMEKVIFRRWKTYHDDWIQWKKK